MLGTAVALRGCQAASTAPIVVDTLLTFGVVHAVALNRFGMSNQDRCGHRSTGCPVDRDIILDQFTSGELMLYLLDASPGNEMTSRLLN